MNEVNKEDLVIQSTNISSALSGLETILYYLPTANEVEVSDLNQIIGTVAAIAALAKKNVGDINNYFEH